MTLSIAAGSARRLSLAQRDAVRAMAEGRVHAIRLQTMTALIRLEIVEAVQGVPKLTEFGAEVAMELPSI